MKTAHYYIPGGLLILLAMVVVAMPEILVALVATAITILGIFVLFVGHRIRIFQNELRYFDTPLFDERSFSRPFVNESYHYN